MRISPRAGSGPRHSGSRVLERKEPRDTDYPTTGQRQIEGKLNEFRLDSLVGPEYSFGLWKIDMVKAVDGWKCNSVARFRCSYGTTVRRIVIQGLVCSPGMIAIQIRRQKSL